MSIYSHSRIGCFESCPLSYFYHYIEKPEVEKVEGIETFMGSRVHEALEKLYKDVRMQKEVSEAGLVSFYNERWLKNWHKAIKIVNPSYSAENYRKVGEKGLRDYFKRHHPSKEGTILGLEEFVDINLADSVKMRGFIDRLVKTDKGTFEIHDYKTSMSRLPLQKQFDADRQLALYSIGIHERFKEATPENTELVWHYLSFGEEFRSRRTEEQLEQLKKETIALIGAIEKAEQEPNFPAKESKLCAWCEFQPICPKQKHIYQTNQLRVNEFLKEEGVTLVNKYVQFKNQLSELSKQLDQVKEALFVYSKEKGVEVIQGSDYKAKVKITEKAKLPNAGEEGRQEIEELVRKEGLWKQASFLNINRVSKLVKEGKIPEEIAEQIKKFERIEEERRIYLSKIKELFE